jgi:hypothetical protein
MRPFRRNPLAALAVLALLLATSPAAAAKRALFDNFHAEQAGNADWVIDDNQPTPSPPQAAIVPSTPRTYWTGAISSWGVDLVKRGFTVTINNAAFTYGNAANPLDLSNFDVLIVPEPNTVFSASEKTALLSFVYEGGGLIAVGDHHISDRNNDGFDSPMIWNALDPTLLLGVHWGTAGDANNNLVQTSVNVNPAPSDSITHGPVGVAPGLAFHNGTTFTISPVTNPSVRGEVWMTGVAQTSTSGIMAASSRYGSGRVFFLGDSSPIDDGSATPGNSNIFDGWAEIADSVLIMNATLWASRREPPPGDFTAPSVTLNSPTGGESWDVGTTHSITWIATDAVGVTAVDVEWSEHGTSGPWQPVALGTANDGTQAWMLPTVPTDSAAVRVTARDAATNSGAATSGLFELHDPNLGVGSGAPVRLALELPRPNPSRLEASLAFALPATGTVRLEILDVSGRRVWSRTDSLPAGTHVWSWGGRDSTGRETGPGLYVVRLLTPWGTRTARLARVR